MRTAFMFLARFAFQRNLRRQLRSNKRVSDTTPKTCFWHETTVFLTRKNHRVSDTTLRELTIVFLTRQLKRVVGVSDAKNNRVSDTTTYSRMNPCHCECTVHVWCRLPQTVFLTRNHNRVSDTKKPPCFWHKTTYVFLTRHHELVSDAKKQPCFWHDDSETHKCVYDTKPPMCFWHDTSSVYLVFLTRKNNRVSDTTTYSVYHQLSYI